MPMDSYEGSYRRPPVTAMCEREHTYLSFG
jgi:hypothetical protein